MRKFFKCIVSISPWVLILFFAFGFLVQEHGKIQIGRKACYVSLPVFIKLAALKEREEYFKVWVEEIIAPGVRKPEEKIDKIFNLLIRFEGVPQSVQAVGIGDIEQHEYYTLIKQYIGKGSDPVRVFCLLVTASGYQAIPFQSEDDGRVVVRIPTQDKWLYYDLRNKVTGSEVGGIELSEEVKQDIRSMDTWLKKTINRKFTRGDMNLLSRRFLFELQKKLPFLRPVYIRAVSNKELVP